MCSCRNMAVHVSDKKGVIYARFDIVAVLPDSSAMAHVVLAVAMENIPFQPNPSICIGFKVKVLSEARLIKRVYIKMCKVCACYDHHTQE